MCGGTERFKKIIPAVMFGVVLELNLIKGAKRNILKKK
ncbi:hypothetical protein C5S32_03875 [ANME-1 cluster archaeon GoMg1]|nr:hypothetical protein [ANME-1 cluster archaeon GoMg1]